MFKHSYTLQRNVILYCIFWKTKKNPPHAGLFYDADRNSLLCDVDISIVQFVQFVKFVHFKIAVDQSDTVQ